jgi:hypothetical protein
MRKLVKRVPRMIAWVTYLCFALRIIAPVGYMPAPLSEGAPFVLCHSGYQGDLVRYLASRNSHHDAASSHLTASEHAETPRKHDGALEHCPMGAAFGSVALSMALPSLPEFDQTSDSPVVAVVALLTATPPPRQPIRAPPNSLRT